MMDFKDILPSESIAMFVKNILCYRNDDPNEKTQLPFFADGYPGIMFHKTSNGLYVMPHNKKMPDFFVYGQTIHPIELKIEGCYDLIVFQLYPFVVKDLFGLNTKDLNENCFDLLQLKQYGVEKAIRQMKKNVDLQKRISIISAFLFSIFQLKKERIDYKIQQSIQLIIKTNGQLSVKQLRQQLSIGERTFERRFVAQVGISPKQFSKIIKFQLSLNQLKDNSYSKLTDVVYDNGFADQSHFIRVFKSYTRKTPKKFNSSLQ
ncbi:MAG: helix-turn-helix transcriptional regulator [Ferruginibacter sp.]